MKLELVCFAKYPQTSLQTSIHGDCELVYVIKIFTWTTHIHYMNVEQVFRQYQSF